MASVAGATALPSFVSACNTQNDYGCSGSIEFWRSQVPENLKNKLAQHSLGLADHDHFKTGGYELTFVFDDIDYPDLIGTRLVQENDDYIIPKSCPKNWHSGNE